ncbi:vasculin-like protein 1 isoform X2 [Oncorhynchus keta]|uniref:vasculin-like protein 1 isoform X2 n=1 Tax=Oncorhynchus keta TaxID=8018 RepID=UPI0015FC72B1|nr:vasculin-like protein 1 isoform X2 [Oncorhynchus keta]
MAQHDFVPAWLNFSTPQPAKSLAAFERHGENLARGDARPAVSRRRHNSSDGFFNNSPLRAPAGDGLHHPSLLRHDSVDSGVAKGGQGGLGSGLWGQEGPHHGRHTKRPVGDRDRERPGPHRQRNGTFHPRKGGFLPVEGGHEDKLKFVEEDFPSLNQSESIGKPVAQPHAVGTPVGVWEHPPSAKQTITKMLVIKKVSKEDPGASFSAGFANTTAVPWKPSGRETKSSFNISGWDSAFTNPAASVNKLLTHVTAPTYGPTYGSPKEPPSSITPPIDVTLPRLKLMRRSTDRKSEFLRGLKDDRNWDGPTSTSPSEAKENRGDLQENGIPHSLSDSDTDHLSSSLEAEYRLLKAMGWQEYPENDDNFLPITDAELQEFQAKTEKLKRNRLVQNGVLLKPLLKGAPLPLLSWRSPVEPELEEVSESESTSSSQTDDDDT